MNTENSVTTCSDSICFYVDNLEMLRVASDGFYVRGKKVAAGHQEAKQVYNTFKQFLVWSELTRS